MSIRTLIVDDEPLARRKIRRFLASEADFVVVGECASGWEAVTAIRRVEPELVFLDVQMPGQDGFSVIEAIGAQDMPATVFVTAFDQYAVQAFDLHAVDYLLKPFDQRRFTKALTRIRAQLERADAAQLNRKLLLLLESLERDEGYSARLAVKTSTGTAFLRVEEIDWIDAAGNYVRLNTRDGESHLLRETMSAMETRLDPKRFVRIHRSTIVNVERIREIRPQTHGEHLIVLDGGQRVTLSRSYRDRLERLVS